MPPLRWLHPFWLALLWSLLVAKTLGSTNTTWSLESPYAELLSDSSSEVERCSQVSGFSFRANTSPTVEQLSRMCADPTCIQVLNILKVHHNADANYPAVFVGFVWPVINYCWFLQAPGDPCPVDPGNDYIARVHEKAASCENATGIAFANGTSESLSKQMTAFFTKRRKCPSDCYVLSQRLTELYHSTLCAVSDRLSDAYTNGVSMWFTSACQHLDATLSQYSYLPYSYLPDWPVPTPPTPTATSQAPASPSPNPDATDGDLHVTATPVPTSTKAPESTDSSQDGGSSPVRATNKTTQAPVTSNAGSVHELAVSPTTKPPTHSQSTTVSTSDAAKDPATGTATPRAANDPSGKEATTSGQSSSHSYTELSAGAASVIVLIVLFAYHRRKSKISALKHDEYSTLDSPSLKSDPAELLSGGQRDILSLERVIPMKHIEDIRVIGSGGHGVVYLVWDSLHSRHLASKRLVQNKTTDATINSFIEEINTVSKLDHPSIVGFIGATWTTRTDIQALFEYMDGGDLRTYLELTPAAHGWNSEKLAIAIDVADALEYVHSLSTPVVHRDLKSRNVLLTTAPRRAKLSDFGVAREVSQNMSMTNGAGTSRWMAPEVILGSGDYGTACDIYSFGALLSELDTHKIPYWDCGGGETGTSSMLPEIAILNLVALEGRQPTFSAACPPEILTLARTCLSHNPQDRPTAAVVASTLRTLANRTAE